MDKDAIRKKEKLPARFKYKDRRGESHELRFIDPKLDPFAEKVNTFGGSSPDIKKTKSNS